MTVDPLASARLKVKWAEKHVANLDSVLQSLRHEDVYCVKVDRNAEIGETRVTVISKGIPNVIALLFGDAIHNIRSALDHAVYGLVPGRNRRTAFVIADSTEGLERRLLEGRIAQTASGVADLIRAAHSDARTYDALLAVRDYDDTDKHHLVVTFNGSTYLPVIEFHPDNSSELGVMLLDADKIALKQEYRVCQVPFLGNAYLHNDMEPPIEVTLGEGRRAGQPILDAVAELTDTVVNVLGDLARISV